MTSPESAGRKAAAESKIPASSLRRFLKRCAEAACGLSPLTWYQATRHTFASQWVLNGGSIEKLKEIMGHCT